MSRRIWTELDYVAGAAHDVHMSYGNYVAAGMPNLERFKRRVVSGEFDRERPKRRSRKGTLMALADMDLGDAAYQKPKKRELPQYNIPEGTCQRCKAVLPAERRRGVQRKYCPECAYKLKRERNTERQRMLREKRKEEAAQET